jgi:hypothetical protein
LAHRVFISFHHQNDDSYRKIFEFRFANRFGVVAPNAVSDGDINPYADDETIRRRIRDDYLRDTTVTVVLVGTETWGRKHVDWEIASSLRDTRLNRRSGLLGIILPSHPAYRRRGPVDSATLPARLADNVDCGYAQLYDWSEDEGDVSQWVHQAFLRRDTVEPDQSREFFRRDRN